MDDRLLLIFIIAFSAVNCEDIPKIVNATAITTNISVQETEKNGMVLKLLSVCEVRNCTGTVKMFEQDYGTLTTL